MIIQSSRTTRASRLRRSRPIPWPVLGIVMLIVGVGAATLIIMAR
jgi:hypothetical protein